MDNAQKLALATRIADLIVKPFPPRPDMPARTAVLMEKMTDRRRALTAELYAEFLSEAQLHALLDYHDGEMARSIAQVMPEINEEFSKRFNALWGTGDSAGSRKVGVNIVSDISGGSLSTAQKAAVTRIIDENYFVETTHQHLIRTYLDAVEAGATGKELAQFYTSDAIQTELPNRLNPQGSSGDLNTLLVRAEQARKQLSKQRLDVLSMVAMDDKVAAEVTWSGTLAVPLGTLAAGTELRAHISMCFEFKDGRIHRQRNYDCFEPW